MFLGPMNCFCCSTSSGHWVKLPVLIDPPSGRVAAAVLHHHILTTRGPLPLACTRRYTLYKKINTNKNNSQRAPVRTGKDGEMFSSRRSWRWEAAVESSVLQTRRLPLFTSAATQIHKSPRPVYTSTPDRCRYPDEERSSVRKRDELR